MQFDISSPETSNRDTFVRAIEESAAYVTRAHLDILDELLEGRVYEAGTFALAGGSSVGELWPKIVASVVGMPAVLARVSEATAFGAARLAGAGVGVDIGTTAVSLQRVYPDATEVAAYDDLYGRWRRAYAAHLQVDASTGLTPLFTPPGALPIFDERPHVNLATDALH